MKTYKYTDNTQRVVYVFDEDGICRSSCLASSLELGCVIATQDAPDCAAEIAEMLNEGRKLREAVLARLNGIQLDASLSGDAVTVSAVAAAKQALKDITKDPGVVAATDSATVKTAFMARYYQIVSDLNAACPYAVTAFRGLDL